MTTLIHDSQSTHGSFSYPVLGARILAATISFLVGRGTALAGRAGAPEPQSTSQSQAADAPVQPAPPWAQQGFRDGETVRATCTTPDCNG
jgi:hypothetical protein